jgi:uncharacterized protein (DUF2147 family)
MKKIQIRGMLMASLLFLTTQLIGQDIAGKWKTIDDETGKQSSIVQLDIRNNQLWGKILETWDDDGVTPTDKLCEKCTGALKDKRIHGMYIITGLSLSDKIWKGKKGILDPKNGKFYDVKIWLEDANTLTVRGSIGPIGRKQSWYRVKE